MIYLIVGQPRSGKSQYAVKLAFDIQDQNLKIAKKVEQGKELSDTEKMADKDGNLIPAIRKIYSDIDEHAENCDFVHKAPPDWRDVEDGSVIIYDEVHFRDEYLDQNKYMSQNPMIKELSIHGHRSIDIYLLTQDPRRLEKSIRALIFKMFLVKRPANLPPFANIYTFDRWLGDPWAASKNADNVHDEQIFYYKKKYQNAYKSASSHTSMSFKIQKKFIWAILIIFVLIAMAIYLFKASGMTKIVKDATDFDKMKDQTTVSSDAILDKTINKNKDDLEQYRVKGLDERTPEQRRADFENELRYVSYNVNKPYEFDESVYKYSIKEMPILSGCIDFDNTCTCYTQQMTKIDISQKDCKRYMSGDKPFNPFYEIKQNQQRIDVSNQEPEFVRY